MTPNEFCIWLSGYLEITMAKEDKGAILLFKAQIELIGNKLKTVTTEKIEVVRDDKPWAPKENLIVPEIPNDVGPL